jgi:hypothetical protein
VKVVHAGDPIGRQGRLVVFRDGQRRGSVVLTGGRRVPGLGAGWVTIKASGLGVGTHRFRVRFVPRSTTYSGSTSRVVTIKVVRRR